MQKTKKIMKIFSRLFGILLLAVGGVLLFFGFYDFITSLIERIEPSLFFCSFFGILVFSIGIVLTSYGFTSKVSLFVKKHNIETSSCGREKVLVEVQSINDAVPVITDRFCASCGTLNDIDSKFCKSCGMKL